jgi:hypothetical protein
MEDDLILHYQFFTMHQKNLKGIFVIFICALFFVCSGCTSITERTSVPATQNPAATETHTVVETPVPTPPITSAVADVGTVPLRNDSSGNSGTLDPDAALDVLFVKSAEEIVNKTVLVIQAMVPGTSAAQLVYSPSVLYLRAEDLGFTTEKYYDQLLGLEATRPENEAKRIAYLQFLYPAKNAAYHLADAAEAESLGDYQTALGETIAAKGYLQKIERNPDLPPITPYNTLDIFLNEYIGRMRDKVIASEMNERFQRGERFSGQ